MLGDLEHDVMQVLWAADGDRSVAQVREVLTQSRPLAYTTVMTVLDRLAKKGLLTRTRVERAYRYLPATSQAEYVAGEIRALLEPLDQTQRRAVMGHLDEP